MMHARPFGSIALALAVTLAASIVSAHAADSHCKATYATKTGEIVFQNFGLTPAEEASSRADCVDQLVEILDLRRLPEVSGKPIPVRLVYALTDDEVFPVIARILGADPQRFFRVEIRFSIPADLAPPSGDPLTEIEVSVRPKP